MSRRGQRVQSVALASSLGAATLMCVVACTLCLRSLAVTEAYAIHLGARDGGHYRISAIAGKTGCILHCDRFPQGAPDPWPAREPAFSRGGVEIVTFDGHWYPTTQYDTFIGVGTIAAGELGLDWFGLARYRAGSSGVEFAFPLPFAPAVAGAGPALLVRSWLRRRRTRGFPIESAAAG